MKKMLSLFMVLFSGAAFATPSLGLFATDLAQGQFSRVAVEKELNMTVGDTNNYSFKSGMFSGTMTMTVVKKVVEGFWVHQVIKTGFGDHDLSLLIDPATGEIIRLISNGEEQTPPRLEVIDNQSASVTVPAGNYDCQHIKSKNLDTNKISEYWINTDEVPVTGMVQSIRDGKYGQVTTKLENFERAE